MQLQIQWHMTTTSCHQSELSLKCDSMALSHVSTVFEALAHTSLGSGCLKAILTMALERWSTGDPRAFQPSQERLRTKGSLISCDTRHRHCVTWVRQGKCFVYMSVWDLKRKGRGIEGWESIQNLIRSLSIILSQIFSKSTSPGWIHLPSGRALWNYEVIIKSVRTLMVRPYISNRR